ncbi:hypothetical protein BH10PSE18_BH10PSE18_07850 [soil metagenome]
MKCPDCGSEDQRVMSTRPGATKVTRLRCCNACGRRWNTIEVDAQNLARMESAVSAVRAFTNLSKELEDAAPAHG